MLRHGVLDIVEGFYTSHAVWTLHRIGALPRLHARIGISALAEQLGCDEQLLNALVDYVYQTTDLLKREGNRYEEGYRKPFSGSLLTGVSVPQ
jgi:hypothetical protein